MSNEVDDTMDEGAMQTRHMEVPEWLSTIEVTSECICAIELCTWNFDQDLKISFCFKSTLLEVDAKMSSSPNLNVPSQLLVRGQEQETPTYPATTNPSSL